MLRKRGSILTAWLLLLITIQPSAVLQAQVSDAGVSPIWGSSPMQGEDGLNQTLADPNWGILPSQQGVNVDMWGRVAANRQTANNQPVYLDIYGRPVLTDQNGDIVYDPQGRPVVDSTIINPNDPILDPPSITIPDDPIDTPLDGGVVLLLMIAFFVGYRNQKLYDLKLYKVKTAKLNVIAAFRNKI